MQSQLSLLEKLISQRIPRVCHSLLLLFVLTTAGLVGCNERQAEDIARPQFKTMQALKDMGRRPFLVSDETGGLVFDSLTYLQERLTAVERIEAYAPSEWEYGKYVQRVKQWITEGYAEEHWRQIHSRLAIDKVLLTWEHATTDHPDYTLNTIVLSNGYIVALYWRYEQDLVQDTILISEWKKLSRRIAETVSSLPHEVCFVDQCQGCPVVILLMYTDKPPVELVSSEMVSHRGEARALDELYDDLFRAMGMYEGAAGTDSHGP